MHIECEDDSLARDWKTLVAEPVRAAKLPAPKLVKLASPYRMVIHPILDYVLKVERENPSRTIVVVVPRLVEPHWYHYFLHNQRGELLAALLMVRGEKRINIVAVPWHLKV